MLQGNLVKARILKRKLQLGLATPIKTRALCTGVGGDLSGTAVCLSAGLSSYWINVMSATSLENAVVTYKEAGIDVRWRNFEDFAKWCGKLGGDLQRTPKAYGKVERRPTTQRS